MPPIDPSLAELSTTHLRSVLTDSARASMSWVSNQLTIFTSPDAELSGDGIYVFIHKGAAPLDKPWFTCPVGCAFIKG